MHPKDKAERHIDAQSLTHYFWVSLLRRARGSHGIRLSSARLTIGKYRHIVSLHEGVYALAEVFPHAMLFDVLTKHPVKHEELFPLCRFHGEACGCGDLDGGTTKALRNEFVSGI
jgi:hypothetical protein